MKIVFVAVLFFSGCKLMTTKEEEKKPVTGTSEIKFFGMGGTDSISEYTLTNATGMIVKIINYGATVTRLIVPDRNGTPGDVVLGFDSLSSYLQPGNPYFGCIVGRYANRIAGAKFTLEDNTYILAANNNGNALHGGLKGFDKIPWTVKSFNDSVLRLSLLSNDGDEGYPGNLNVQIVYSVTASNSLKIEYTATTDKPTPVNLTNHCYFNLSAGMDSNILDHELMLKADKYTPVDDQLIPTGKIDEVKGTAMDFTVAKKIGKDIGQVAGGYDHNWVLKRDTHGPDLIGSLYHAGSGRYMEVFTTQPGIQFYSGNFLDGSLTGKNGIRYIKHAGLCLETQHFPDSPNQPSFPNTIVRPGETYHHITIYKFSGK